MSVIIECKTCLGEFNATPRIESNQHHVETFVGWNVGSEIWRLAPNQVDKTSMECHECVAARTGLTRDIERIRKQSQEKLQEDMTACREDWEAGRVAMRERQVAMQRQRDEAEAP